MTERIAKILSLSEEEVKRRVSYVNLTSEEIELLKELSERVSDEDIVGVFDEFYRHLLSFEETRRILESEEGLIERLKEAQTRYFRELLRADYTIEYALSRLKVGEVHERIGVDPKYYTGAFAKWVESILQTLKEKVSEDKLIPTLLALFKAVILDITFSLDAYLFSKVIRSTAPRYRIILNSVKDAIFLVDLQTMSIVDLNPAALELLGLEKEEDVVGRDALWIHPEELRPVMEEKFRKYVKTGKGITEIEYVENKRSGEWIPVEISYGTFKEDGKSFVVGVFRDIRERLRREEIIKRINRLYETLSRINILTTTVSSREDLLPSAMRILREGGFRYAGAFRKGRNEAVAEEGVFLEEDASVCIPMEGDLYLLISRWSEDGFTKEEVELLREVAHDLSFALRKIGMEERLSRLELYDETTQLPNRIHFLRRLSDLIDKAKRDRKEVGLLLMDIDNFSELNEAFGHERVDKLLKEIARRLRSQVRESDFIGRVGVDEFGVILVSEDANNALDKLLSRIKKAFGEPFKIDSQEVYITFSSGVSVFPEDVDTGERLFSNASYSLQRAKEMGGNRVVYYSQTTDRAILEKVKLRTDLRKAIDKKEFVLYYQPKVDLRTGKVVGAEALLRWKKNGKLIPPNRFIPVLEESELIHEVGEWILREACRQTKEWRAKGIEVPIAVNVSAVQLKNPNFVEDFFRMISNCDGECRSLELEITESAVMEDVSGMIEALKALHSAGVKIYIDDFGTGYSSLAYLKKLPVYALKIDIEFIKDIPHDQDDLEIVKATIGLAKTFGLKTVAEGVEKEEQVEILRELGCDFGQGYYFGKPMPPEEFEAAILK